MNKQVRVGIVGGAGYTGGELLRLLLNHPQVTIGFVHSRSQAGRPVTAVHADLAGETALQFSAELSSDIDVLFLCVGHGEAKKFLQENAIAPGVRLIDLSQDFRLEENASFAGRRFVYGLPELNRDVIREAHDIANPGCFATALQLGLLPLAKAGLLTEVYTTGITGSTGAGQGLAATSHFSWRANNIQAYKTLTHQHLKEIDRSLRQLGATARIHFVPWRGDFPRGIFVSSTLPSPLSKEAAQELYEDYYRDHPFTVVSREPVFLKQAVNTSKCLVQLEQEGDTLVIHSVIDNLLKGASGQAVQNMNLLFGFDEQAGLKLKPLAF